MGVAKHVIGSLGDLGMEVLKETAKIPVEIAGTAAGVSTEKTTQPQESHSQNEPQIKGEVPQAFTRLDRIEDPHTRRQQARGALLQFVGSSANANKEPTLWEKKQQEEKQQKHMHDQEKEARKKELRPVSTKRKSGKFGIGVKTNIEKQRDVKAE